jgi:hypothetical protein
MLADRSRAPRARLLAPLTLLVALALTLAFAGTAAAETKIGEATSPEQAGLAGEGDLLKGSVEYDVATGKLSASFTTTTAPESTVLENRPVVEYIVGLFDANFPCTVEGAEAQQKKQKEEGEEPQPPFPLYEAMTYNGQLPERPGYPVGQAWAFLQTRPRNFAEAPENIVAASKSIGADTLTLGATNPIAANHSFNCVEMGANSISDSQVKALFFPLTTKPEPPPSPPATQTPTTTQQPSPPAPAPAAISIAKAKKPLKLKRGKWTTVKVTVTNTGGTATTPGSLQLKAAKGVLVKVKSQKLPSILPGESWPVTYKVKLTAKAKKNSTLSLVGTAGTVTSKSSLVLKLAGG